MNLINLPRKHHLLPVSAIALIVVSFSSCFAPVRAQSDKPGDRGNPTAGRSRGGATHAHPQFNPPLPPDRGIPEGRRKGGASRGDNCSGSDKKQLTALVPATPAPTIEATRGSSPANSEYVWALTFAERPTLWFYVPCSLTSDRPLKFVLQDERGLEIYNTTFTVSTTSPGIVKFRLPSNAAPLEIGKMYNWYFMINGDEQESVSVEGWVERVAPSATLAAQLQKATPQQRVALYAANGIWHDALNSLAELAIANPKDAAIAADWVSLLESVGLEAIAREPIAPCCTPEK